MPLQRWTRVIAAAGFSLAVLGSFKPARAGETPAAVDPRLGHRDFNPKAFINCHAFGYFDNVLAYVMHLDSPEGKQEYLDMLTAPAFKDNKPTEWMNFDSCFWTGSMSSYTGHKK